MKQTFLILLAILANVAFAQKPKPPRAIGLRSGLVIRKSVSIKPGTYRLPAPPSPDSAVITIRGDSITVDFGGATLQGSDTQSDPDGFSGVAIRIDGGKNVSILHAKIRGYKIGILAQGTRGLALVDNDVSYNWKPRLFSLIEHESLVDWLSFHHNDKSEWLRYGAGIYLASVRGGAVRNNRCEQGMNGLLIVRSDHVLVTENNFSFNSGVGIGLYRSNYNRFMYNRLDYNVRGYSHRFYHRGQDSADMLVYEQSSANIVAYNSATHGGDGFFLWAGQTTMDSGTGGANDNILYKNNFSFSPANGIEATFSRNIFLANRLEGNDYGIWGGYSFTSSIVRNRFIRNRVGVAIEHGQQNKILANRFDGDSTAISLWATPIEQSDWGYPKYRDTRSHDYTIEYNTFVGNRYGLKALNTSDLVDSNNRWSNVDTAAIFRDSANVRREGIIGASDTSTLVIPPEYVNIGEIQPFDSTKIPRPPLAKKDRSAIIVDEWGPYDYASPKLWPSDSSHGLPLLLRTLGEPGKWNVVGRRGVANLSSLSGTIGDTIAVTPAADSAGDWEVTLEYLGKETKSPRGERRSAGKPYRFSFERFEPAIDWSIRFVAWTESADPRTHNQQFNALFQSNPILTQHAPRIDYEWFRPTFRELPQERFAFEATGTVTLSPGDYTLRTISDDGVRVWVDSMLVIDNWTQHGSTLDFATVGGGPHALRVQYFQVDGWAEIRLDILRGIQRSKGSPE